MQSIKQAKAVSLMIQVTSTSSQLTIEHLMKLSGMEIKSKVFVFFCLLNALIHISLVSGFASMLDNHHHHHKLEIAGTVFIATLVDGFVAREDGDISWLSPPPAVDDNVNANASKNASKNANASNAINSNAENGEEEPNTEDDMGFAALLDSVDCIVMGRVTFDTVVSFGQEAWPYGNKPLVIWTRDPQGVTSRLPPYLKDNSNGKKCKQGTETGLGTVSASDLPPKQLFRHLEQQGFRTCYVDGPAVIQHFLRERLIRYLHITTIPILLGKGIRLFADKAETDAETDSAEHHTRTCIQEEVQMNLEESKAYPNGMVSTKYQLSYHD